MLLFVLFLFYRKKGQKIGKEFAERRRNHKNLLIVLGESRYIGKKQEINLHLSTSKNLERSRFDIK